MSTEEPKPMGLTGRIGKMFVAGFLVSMALTFLLLLCGSVTQEPLRRVFANAFLTAGIAMMAFALLSLITFAIDPEQGLNVEFKNLPEEKMRWPAIVLMCVFCSLLFAMDHAGGGTMYALSRTLLLILALLIPFVVLGVLVPAALAKVVKGERGERLRATAENVGLFVAFLTLVLWSAWYRFGYDGIRERLHSVTAMGALAWVFESVGGLVFGLLVIAALMYGVNRVATAVRNRGKSDDQAPHRP